MSTFFEMDCGGETVTLERTNNGDIIFHNWDEETELAAIELGFEPSDCWIVWDAINNDILNEELFEKGRQGNALLVKALIFAGASVDARGISDWTPLHYAATHGHADTVKVLLEAGASVDAKNNILWTPLYLAARWGHTAVVNILLKAGASVDQKDCYGNTTLKYAQWENATDVLKILEDWIEEHGE